MPDFTVIEGGGKKHDSHAAAVQQFLELLIVELFRAVPRGGDPDSRVATCLVVIMENLAQSSVPLASIVNSTLEICHRHLDLGTLRHHEELNQIVSDSLLVAAESLAQDPAAKGRRSQRKRNLEEAIKSNMVNSERRSRDNGWSFLHHIMEERLGDKPTKRRFGPSKDRDPVL